jgi:hypothetical protein
MFKKSYPAFILFISFGLISCATVPPEPVDWIEVPLSDNTFSENAVSYQEGVYDILVKALTALEYKVGVLQGDSIVYRWQVEMEKPELLTAEFHGHTERVGEEPGTVMFYKIHNNGEESGRLTAPFSGIHGWYLNNESEEDIVVSLTVSGFYEELD